MKIIVTAETDEPYRVVSDITFPIIQEYCDRHGYEFRPKVAFESERGPVWERVRSLQSVLQDCDWAVHVDSDLLITNHLIPLTEFIENDKSIVISCAPYRGVPMFNDGFCMFKNDFKARSILDRCWNMHDPENGIFCAQDAMWSIFRYDYYQSRYFSVQPQKRFDSFLWDKYGEPNYTQGSWTKGDFALHLPGMTNESRVALLSQYMPEIIR